MLGDAVIILANMRGGYVNVGDTVHTLFRMSGKPRRAVETEQVARVPEPDRKEA